MGEDPKLKDTFTQLLETYAAPMRRLCAVYASSSADSEDLFQDICLAVWRALPVYRGDASARTWLYRIAHNVVLTWQARTRRRQLREAPLDDDLGGPDEAAMRRLALNQTIGAMTPADRTLILLWLEGLSAAEIEEVTGVKAPTVAVRLSRIRKQITRSGVTP